MSVIGITAGSFDVIHPGYVRLFKEAKQVCDHLIVALQGDPTIERPEKCKPVQSLEDRIEILLSIKYVDEILTYDTEQQLLDLLKNTKYDVRIIGADYKGRSFTGDYLKPVHYCSRDHDYSTTRLKEKIKNEMLNHASGSVRQSVWQIDSHYY